MIKVATVVNTHGLKGVMKLVLHTDSPMERFKPGQVLKVGSQSMTVDTFYMNKHLGYVRFIECTDVESAQAFKGELVTIDEDQLPELESGHLYYWQMMDCQVYKEDGSLVGQVVDVLETGVHPVLRVKGSTQHLIPFHEAFVLEADAYEKRIVVRWQEGL